MKIFTDLHHVDLYHSLHLLFEKRLNFEIYRPICEKTWFNQTEIPDFVKCGAWQIHNSCRMHDPVDYDLPMFHQYLTLGCGENLIWNGYDRDQDIHKIYNPAHNYHSKCIDLRTFKDMEFDIIMPTHTVHYKSFEKLLEFQPKAKYVCHVGNSDVIIDNCENVIHSVTYKSNNKNKVLVHQELDSNCYKHIEPNTNTKNLFAICQLYQYKEIYEEYKQHLTDLNMRYHGTNTPDGVLHGTPEVGKKMQEANLAWSTKYWGGLGHTNMGWFYSGRALVTNMSEHYRQGGDTLDLFEPGYNCIDLDSNTTHENCKLIREWMKPENQLKYGNNAKKRFHEVINYDHEAENVKKFLENLI